MTTDRAVAAETSRRRPYYWTRYAGSGDTSETPVAPGADLAALRRGLGQEPGAAPALWRFYTELTDDGWVTDRLRAEHAALVLFGIHQQSQRRSMHWPGVRLGQALQALRASGRYSEPALDRRVAQCATADDLGEMTHHLRGLITMLKTIPRPQGLDYTLLVRDLTDWQDPAGRSRVRRRWGADYFRSTDRHTSPSERKDALPS